MLKTIFSRCFFGWLMSLMVLIPIQSQSVITEKNAPGKLAKQYAEALTHYRQQDFVAAIGHLDKIIKSKANFIDAWLLRGAAHFDQRNYAAAESDYEQAIALDANYFSGAYYELGRAEQLQMKYEEAISHFTQYLSNEKLKSGTRRDADRELANARFAADAVRNPLPITPQSLGDSINTAGPEYLPSLTADAENLIYTVNNAGSEDFYLSHKVEGHWSRGVPLEAVNTPRNEAAQCISADGRTLVFTADYGREGLGGFDLYIAEVRGRRWNKAANLGAPVNTAGWESQPSLSADGHTLIFASDRAGGQGGRDLWMSQRSPDGKWSTPINLGPGINTPGHEQAPFLHADGQTLYFMSDGRPGMGQADLYLSRLDAQGQWQTPQNLGYPINTPDEEGALVVSTDGATAYFTRRVGEPAAGNWKPNLDIYSFVMPAAIRPQPVTYVKARIKDNDNGQRLQALVEITDLSKGKTFVKATTDTDGEFLFCLPAGVNYALNVSKTGYLFHSEYFALAEPGADLSKPFVLDIGLSRIPEPGTANSQLPNNQPVILRNIFFDSGDAALRPESTPELERLKALLVEHPALRIRIQGHTDNIGADSDNLSLSEKRAKAVFDYLVKNGIKPERLAFAGFGESQPIDTNNTAEGRRNNRRTEFVIIR